MPEPTTISGSEQYLDPDCRDGKHTTCYGSPCSCLCHRVRPWNDQANQVQDDVAEQLRGLVALDTARSVDEALAWLEQQSRAGTDFGIGWCLRVQRTAWNVAPKYATAWLSGAAAQRAGDLHADAPPRGAIGYYSGGSGAGHVVTLIGDGTCWTTDFLRDGKLDRVSLDDIRRYWSNLQWRGWSHTINDVVVLGDEQPEQPPGDDDMSAADVQAIKDHIDAIFAGAVGPGQRTFAGTVGATLADVQATYNAVRAVPGQIRPCTIVGTPSGPERLLLANGAVVVIPADSIRVDLQKAGLAGDAVMVGDATYQLLRTAAR